MAGKWRARRIIKAATALAPVLLGRPAAVTPKARQNGALGPHAKPGERGQRQSAAAANGCRSADETDARLSVERNRPN
eukprot:SAG25_NODE_160_length_13390_cov_9.002708_2_plen_78_part_00